MMNAVAAAGITVIGGNRTQGRNLSSARFRYLTVFACVCLIVTLVTFPSFGMGEVAGGNPSGLKLVAFNPLPARSPPATGPAHTNGGPQSALSPTPCVSNIKDLLVRVFPVGGAVDKSGPLLAAALKSGELKFLAVNGLRTTFPLKAINVTASSYSTDGSLPMGLVVSLRLPQESLKSKDAQIIKYMRKIRQYDAEVLHRKDPKPNAYMRKYMVASFRRMCVQTVVGRYRIVVKYSPKGLTLPLGGMALRGTRTIRVVDCGVFMDRFYKELVV